jgi:uncharacterized C2H2 Zn-finger protein
MMAEPKQDNSRYKITIWKCQMCDSYEKEENISFEPLYECSFCGRTFTRSGSYDGESHRCPDCMKFSSKLTDKGCPECMEGEMEEAEGWECPNCDEIFDREEDFTDHLKEEDDEDDLEEDEND